MKRTAVIALSLFLAASAFAQEDGTTQVEAAAKPDFSKPTLIRIFANNPVKEPVQPRVQLGFGYIDFRALKMRWRFNYLPIMMPIQGSIPWASNQAFGNLPNPFIQTGTEIASPPRTWRQMRDMNAELRRIEKSEKNRAKVVANPE